MHGTYHVVPRLPSGVLLFLLLLPVHYLCLLAGVSVLILTTGNILGILTPVGKKVKTTEHYTLSFKQSKGKQEVTEYDNDAGAMAKAQLLTAEGTGTARRIWPGNRKWSVDTDGGRGIERRIAGWSGS